MCTYTGNENYNPEHTVIVIRDFETVVMIMKGWNQLF